MGNINTQGFGIQLAPAGFSLEANKIFVNYAAALEFVKTKPAAYEGSIIAVMSPSTIGGVTYPKGVYLVETIGESAVLTQTGKEIDLSNYVHKDEVATKGADKVLKTKNDGKIEVDTTGNAATADNANHATSADSADEANHATSADNANHATSADNANHATSADNANHATSADSAVEANHATSADSADEANHATSADNANHATSADSAVEANHATSADSADEANHATSADNANHATSADSAVEANLAESLNWDNVTVAINIKAGHIVRLTDTLTSTLEIEHEVINVHKIHTLYLGDVSVNSGSESYFAMKLDNSVDAEYDIITVKSSGFIIPMSKDSNTKQYVSTAPFLAGTVVKDVEILLGKK